MSLYSPRSQAVFAMAERERLEPPEDAHDFLADKPEELCPWCNRDLEMEETGDDSYVLNCRFCHQWDPFETVEDNRQRYAKEKEAEAKLEARIARESAKRGIDL